MPITVLSIRDKAVSKIPTSGESGNDSNTDFMTAGEGSAKEKCGDMLGQKIAKPTLMIGTSQTGRLCLRNVSMYSAWWGLGGNPRKKMFAGVSTFLLRPAASPSECQGGGNADNKDVFPPEHSNPCKAEGLFNCLPSRKRWYR